MARLRAGEPNTGAGARAPRRNFAPARTAVELPLSTRDCPVARTRESVMRTQENKMLPLRKRPGLGTGPAHRAAILRRAGAGGLYGVMTAVAVVFILGVVFFGLNAHRPEGIKTASAPSASVPAPTGVDPAARATTGEGAAETTGQAAPLRDTSGTGVSPAQPQPNPQDAR